MFVANRLTFRSSLLIDAVVSGATALLMLVAAGPLGDLLALPRNLLRVSGAVLIPFVAFVVIIATRAAIARAAVWTVIALNLAWVSGSIILLIGKWGDPNPLGFGFIVFQAAIVALFAWIQFIQVVEDEARTWTSTATA